MKKILPILLIISFVFSGCSYDAFGHETYTSVEDYNSAFELSEIRFTQARDEMFPRDVTDLNVERFYCEWELGIVGSADFEMILSVNYGEKDFNSEILRLESLVGGNVVYDEENFLYPAYVTVLGAYQTSVYALVDENALKIHYIYVQLTDKTRIDIGEELLPKGYYGFGDVSGNNYDVYT